MSTLPEKCGRKIVCYVYPLGGKPYADGLETVELGVTSDFHHDPVLPKLEPRRRLPWTLKTPIGIFRAGLRRYPRSEQWLYMCPDLYRDNNGSRISLARILRELQIPHHSRIDVMASDGQWELVSVRTC